MPIFNGEDTYGWVYRAERYFEIQRIRWQEQINTAALCMMDAALAWYRWSNGRSPFRSWKELKGWLLDRFQSVSGGDLYEQFLAITQVGSARDYVSEFEKRAGQLRVLSEPILEGTFIKGLKSELRNTLRIMQPASLTESMKLAIMLDENQSLGKGPSPVGAVIRQPTRSAG